jgi:hypothetical protein
MGAGEPNFSSESGRGAFVSHTYVERDVKTYAIFESEVSHLSTFNTLATIFFSVGSAFLAFAVGIWTNWSFVDKKTMPPEGVLLSTIGVWFFIGGAVLSYMLALWAMWKRGSSWSDIRKQSKSPRQPPMPPMA